MATVDLPYLEKNTAKGRIYYRYRRNGLRLALPPDPSSKEFMDAYTRIHEGFEKEKEVELVAPESITALIDLFKKSAEFSGLKPRVKLNYHHNLDLIKTKLGKFPARSLTRRVVLEWRDKFLDTPAKANHLVSAISRLYSFGIDRGLVTQNPITNIKRLKLGEWRPWTLEEVTTFQEKAPAPMRLALALALYTGQRLGDVLKMRWDQIHDNGINVVQEKTGENVWIPIHQDLKVFLDEIPDRQSQTILTSVTGQPFKTDHFKHQFKDASRKAGLPDDLVFHGLRKTAAVRLAEAGCSTEQIKSITGHRTDDMVAHYTKQANQKVLARAAMRRFERE